MNFDAIDTPLERGTNLLEASAGTGKTYTLAAIFLRLIVEDGLRIGQILVTTYTEAATAELRDRIRRRLHAASTAWSTGTSDDALLSALLARRRVAPELAHRRLESALHAFDEAAIYTIHGFCQRMLQDRAFESRVLFDVELVTDQSALLREISEDYWRTHFYTAPPVVVAAALEEKLDPAALAAVLRVTGAHPRLRLLPAVDHAAARQRLEELHADFRAQWPGWRESVRALFLDASDWATGDCKKPEVMEPRLDLVDDCATLPAPSREAFAALGEFTQEAIGKQTHKKRTGPTHPFFQLCTEIAAARRRFAVSVEADFLAWARQEQPRRKEQANVHSFDDLLTRLHGALRADGGDALANVIRTRFSAALIDEFQDTDPIQEEIFRTIFATGEHWLYLIGDPKQAIYGFRGADVFTYLGAAARADRTYVLGTNHRSAAALVKGVNTIFARPALPFVEARIGFGPVRPAGRADQTPLRLGGQARAPFRLWLPETSDPLVATRVSGELPARVAGEIARLLAGGATLGGDPLAPPDIAVLTMRNEQARAIQAALSARGIPSVLMSNASVFASREAAQLQTLLAAVAEPLREPLLRAALATRVLGLTAAEIDALATDERGWEQWLLQFQRWNRTWRERGFIVMFRELLRETAARQRLLRQPDGERALTNVLHLGELLHQAACELRLAPLALVHWLADRRRESGTPATEHELRLERDEDAVKVVTVHKSKGLEYGVVFCPFGWGKADLRKGERPLFHDAPGLTLDLGSDDLATHHRLAQREKLAEQTRLLYVALTRAKYECHFVWGRFEKNDVSAAMWVLHPSPPGAEADPLAAVQARADALSPDDLRREMEALAASAPDALAVEPWPDAAGPATPALPASTTTPAPAAREFRGAIEHDWRVSSFSSLTEHRDTEQPDYDRAPAAGEAVDTGVTPTGIHAFAAGKPAGVCLHAIFEEHDFTDAAALPALVEKKLAAFAFNAKEWRGPVADCVRHVLAVELAPGLRLAEVPRAARLDELEFTFPVARLEAAQLGRVLEIEGLDFEPRRGLLRGFIDLVFEHAGRFYIVDWKSNRLGHEASAYHRAALAQAMARHRYGLQYHLYTLALHRYLALRLGASYDYERHFGGVFYVFLRGVDPAQPELGVFRDCPSAARIAALDAQFSTRS